MVEILVLCSRTPYPLTGGAKLRMFNTAALLSHSHEVDLLVVDEEPVEQERITALKEQFREVYVFTYPKYRFYLNTFPGLVSKKPLQTFYFYFDNIVQWINRNEERYDLLYCNHVRTTEFARGTNVPKIVDLVDAISRNYAESGEGATGVWRALYPLESKRLRRYERNVVKNFDHSFIITEEDKSYIEPKHQSFDSLSVLPNGVRKELLETTPEETDGSTIAFLGKMDYFPNEDAVTYFVEDIFPRIVEQCPDAKFVIIGTNPTERIRNFNRILGVEVTGFVDDPIEYLSTATVVIAPMRFGAGLQNKVLESMALKKPVVTTPLGREGIEADDDVHLSLATDADELADAVVSLLKNQEKRRKLGVKARRLIQKKYTWDVVQPTLLNAVEETLYKGQK